MAKRGRPPKGEYPEKKRVFASRVREDTWEMLQRAAAKSSRSVSQEFEFRLRRGLDEALEVITRTLKGFRPLTATNLETAPPEFATPALAETVREIQAADPTRPLGKVSKRERAILRLQSELGDLVDRPGRPLEAKH